MPERFEPIVEQARRRGTAYYEADPTTFASPALFRELLDRVAQRYPDLRIALRGAERALTQLGLAGRTQVPGLPIRVVRGDTAFLGFVRLTFDKPGAWGERETSGEDDTPG